MLLKVGIYFILSTHVECSWNSAFILSKVLSTSLYFIQSSHNGRFWKLAFILSKVCMPSTLGIQHVHFIQSTDNRSHEICTEFGHAWSVPIIKIRQSCNHLVFITGILYLERWSLYWNGLRYHNTVETLYSTIYYSKYFIELNINKSTLYVALWTHKRHSIPRPFGRAMECLLWVLQQKLIVL